MMTNADAENNPNALKSACTKPARGRAKGLSSIGGLLALLTKLIYLTYHQNEVKVRIETLTDAHKVGLELLLIVIFRS